MKRTQTPIITLEDVTKSYTTSKNKQFTAVRSINVNIMKGERIGIVGDNGAGKTTLLKIIGGSTKPTHGNIHRHGSIVSLIDLEAGFEPELTGNENIMVNGLLIGMKKNDIKKVMKSIIRFSGIGSHIHEPFYTYSAGMKFRLACAVAIHSKADVLLFDEILINGDWKFQKKIFTTLTKTFKNSHLTTIICTHFPEILWSLANTYYHMSNGSLKKISKKHIRSLIIARHTQFHSAFKTNEIEEFAFDRKRKKSL